MGRAISMIDRNDIQIVVFDYRGVNLHLRAWMDAMPNARLSSDICEEDNGPEYLLAMRRNIIAHWFLEKTNKSWLMMINDNIIPLESISKLLDCEADVAGAGFFSRQGVEGHLHEGETSTAAMKISRNALKRIARPWFKFVFNDYHTQLAQCECGWFCKQARAAGFHPMKVGLVAHEVKVALIPPKENGGSCQMKFLQDIPLVKGS